MAEHAQDHVLRGGETELPDDLLQPKIGRELHAPDEIDRARRRRRPFPDLIGLIRSRPLDGPHPFEKTYSGGIPARLMMAP